VAEAEAQNQETTTTAELAFRFENLIASIRRQVIMQPPTRDRVRAYIELVLRLMQHPSGDECRVLSDHSTLIDDGFIATLRTMADGLAARGDERRADYLRRLSNQLGPLDSVATTRSNKILSQLLHTVDVFAGDAGNQLYSILDAHPGALGMGMLVRFRASVGQLIRKGPREQWTRRAAIVAHFGKLVQEYPRESPIRNEFAIVAYEAGIEIFSRETFPLDWAAMQNNLGNTYFKRIWGEPSGNVEKAIAAYQAALEVYTRDDFPENWAQTQTNLGTAHSKRIQADRAENLERAVQTLVSALEVCTRDSFPVLWATAQNSLGNVYLARVRGDRAENLERALAAYEAALTVRTIEVFPFKWAQTQNNLGEAYRQRCLGDPAENLELAIRALEAALKVYTRQSFPPHWAGIQHNLGIAYFDRIRGDRAENVELGSRRLRQP
jgi:tetratricopeptide (TPR) repeat protein